MLYCGKSTVISYSAGDLVGILVAEHRAQIA